MKTYPEPSRQLSPFSLLLRDNIFIPSRGSRKKALKVMVVLTDGDIFGDPLNLTTVINSPKMQGVVRFAIGVSTKSWEANLTLYRLGKGAAQWRLCILSKPSLLTVTPLLLATCSYRPPSFLGPTEGSS
jgi:hypothetical protein